MENGELSLRMVTLKQLGLIATFLCIPLFAMQVTEEVKWGLGDFSIAGFLLFVACMAYNWSRRSSMTRSKRYLFYFLVLTILVLIWVELAVGIIN